MSGGNNLLDEKWTRWVALMTTILAVSAAIASLKGGSYSTKVQLMTTTESSKWSYFQSKSTKQHVVEMQKDLFKLEALKNDNPDAKKYIDERIKFYESEIARYDQEKNEIKTQAEDFSKQENIFKRHGLNFSMGVMYLQIAIMLSSMSVLLKKRMLWISGVVLGSIGLFYVLNGFLLFF
jgi:hypothetical protein